MILAPPDPPNPPDPPAGRESELPVSEQEEAILAVIEKDPGISQRLMADALGMNFNTLKYYIRKLQEKGKLERHGTSQKGYWMIK